jgi:hypothetical protein
MTKIKAMTEPEWLASTNAWRMLRYVQQHLLISRTPGGARRLRLLAVACCRQVWPLLTDPRSRAAIEVAERYADGKARKAELQEACETAQEVEQERQQQKFALSHPPPPAQLMPIHQAWVLASMAVSTARTQLLARAAQLVLVDLSHIAAAGHPGNPKAAAAARQQGEAAASGLLHDLFGNPFRPAPTILDSWLTWNAGTVKKLAWGIYDERAFGRLPMLADALEEAGCTDTVILDHCRRDGLQARGCWLVDLLLGKS